MPVLDDDDMRELRAIQDDNRPHRARLQSPVGTEKTSGGWSVNYQDYAVNVPARLTPITGTEVPVGTVLTPETNSRLSLPYGTPVAPQDRAIVTGTTNGVAWEVIVGITFVASPKAFQSDTTVFCTDKIEQVSPI